MTPERAKELLPIIQAFAEGKKIESKAQVNGYWRLVENPLFRAGFDYRIAKERKWYRVALMHDGNGEHFTTTADSHYEYRNYSERCIEETSGFIRWLTDRVYYEVD